MKEIYISFICGEMSVKPWQVENCVTMLEDGDTVPFISRYRKEKTGNLDDSQVALIKHYAEVFAEMEKRKKTILETIDKAGALTKELSEEIESTVSAQHLEDLYLPYRPKRRTKATVARELGLEGLADIIWNHSTRDAAASAARFVKPGKVDDTEAALQGARDIIAERISETPLIRENLRAIFRTRRIEAKVIKKVQDSEEASKYRSYFNFCRPLEGIPSHNLLAILRASSEGILTVGIDADEQKCCNKIYYDICSRNGYPCESVAAQLKLAVNDAYRRLLQSSIETEVLKEAKRKADIASIEVFGDNLRQLLLSPPLGSKRIMAVDPGFRNGCKIACLDELGNLLHYETVFPHPPQSDKIRSMTAIGEMISKYGIEEIAIGNGTASRETEEFLRRTGVGGDCRIWTVSEDGASIYSASQCARDEFPDEDVTVRGAVSIGRRLMDPLAELVKIDPKSLGVGQYQHDVDQTLLKDKLDATVEYCVNSVGVNLNTASPYLLAYVSGIGTALAENIVAYRNETGGFSSRAELLKVRKLGAKSFEQCAGFLRIKDGVNPLDSSAVHPESYDVVDRMAASLGVTSADLVGNRDLCGKLVAADFVDEKRGLPTINDIISELCRPGLDPRQEAVEFSFSEEIHSLEDLKEGMELPGIVTNITAFGAFVDIGLHENGLLHVSQMGVRNLFDPGRVVKLHQRIKVTVIAVDMTRKRISLRLSK